MDPRSLKFSAFNTRKLFEEMMSHQVHGHNVSKEESESKDHGFNTNWSHLGLNLNAGVMIAKIIFSILTMPLFATSIRKREQKNAVPP